MTQHERSAPGDFDFLTGTWSIANRKRQPDGSWDEFPGEATVTSAMGGMASVEDLRIPARGFAGMGVRVFDVDTGRWADHWVSARNGVVNDPMMGGFVDGAGVFESTEVTDGRTVVARGTWDRITPTSCRWQQATSTDGGATWELDWSMDWTRVDGGTAGPS